MNLFTAFSRHAPNTVFWSILAGIAAGFAYSLLIPIIMLTFHQNGQQGLPTVKTSPSLVLGFEVSQIKIAAVFLCACIFILIMRTYSQVMLMRVSMDVTTQLRIEIYKRILRAPIASLESFGSARLIAMITTDVGNIVMGARALPDILISFVSVLGVLGFLLYLNQDVFWFVIITIFFGVLVYQIPMFIGSRYFERARVGIDALHEGFRGLIYGAKELKLDSRKRSDYMEGTLVANEKYVLHNDKVASTIVTAAANYGDLISFFVIGFIVFIFANYHSVTTVDLIGVTMALLYITGPIGIIVNSIPNIAIAKVAMKKVKESLADLSEEEYCENINPISDWKEIRFSGVTYQYESDAQTGFVVGPLDFSISRGEVTIIVGGNGSGKSTLSKLLTLHYQPKDGNVYFDEQLIDKNNTESFRQEISAIYSDYYLFERLLGDDNIDNNEVDNMLRELALDKKVYFRDRSFSTLSLSDGQRRRLALLISYLADKSFYLFDEWAADQDPVFKEFFYYTMLPRLRGQQKAVVVISHDDRYFEVADKIIEMEDGKIKRIQNNSVLQPCQQKISSRNGSAHLNFFES